MGMIQELGGLLGRIALAWLALRIVSRQTAAAAVPGAGAAGDSAGLRDSGGRPFGRWRAWMCSKVGMFFTGFFTVAQFSFFGNYLPRMYPTHIRGTGESFAANVGGRMFGTGRKFRDKPIGVHCR